LQAAYLDHEWGTLAYYFLAGAVGAGVEEAGVFPSTEEDDPRWLAI
jgi:hypothetical protein